jgi:pimeloyl-ACP methyl ester carboxylesterase
MNEYAHLVGCSSPLVAIITTPGRATHDAAGKPALILLNAGIVHHIGPARWSVRLARRMAERGHVAVRFDHAGIGDSDPRRDARPFHAAAVDEVREVIDSVQRMHGVDSFVVMGLCSGASTSILCAQSDPRVIAAIAVNPPGIGGESSDVGEYLLNEGWAQRYFKKSLLNPRAWWRAITGRIEYRRLCGVMWTHICNRVRPPDALEDELGSAARLLVETTSRGKRVFFVLSQNDEGIGSARKLLDSDALRQRVGAGLIQETNIAGTDHTFALQCNQEQLFETVERFIDGLPAPAPRPLTADANPNDARISASQVS